MEGVSDNDHNGQKEIYGRLSIASIDTAIVDKSITWIRTEYMAGILTYEEITDWANVLASYWYPTLNTDMVDVSSEKKWPPSDAPQALKKELNGLVVDNPAAVICGKPFGKPLYNVFVVENVKATEKAPEGAATADTAPVIHRVKDSSVSRNFEENRLRFAAEPAAHGGDYSAWERENAEAYSVINAMIIKLPSDQMGIEGTDGWLFFRKEISYILGGDLFKQPEDKNPIPHIVEFHKLCADHGIDLLFVPVPNKSDVYFEKLSADLPQIKSFVNPYGRKFLRDLQESGVEVIDLLPGFLKAKEDDAKSYEALYQKHDTHWTNRGLQIAAEMIARRMREYQWFPEAKKTRTSYLIHDTTFVRQGDIVDKLPENRRNNYPPVLLQASQIRTTDGRLFRQNNPAAPVLLIGDSFTGVFEIVDCKSAGVGANIAALTSIPVDIITSWGGGPLVRDKMLRSRSNDLGRKRLIIYMMVARDLFDYAQGWN